MTHDKIPIDAPALNDRPRSNYPHGGAKTGPAWRAAWDGLRESYAESPDAYVPSSVIASAVVEKVPDVSPDTVKNLLLSAFRFGVLDKRMTFHNHRHQASFRIADSWINQQGR